MNFLRVMYVMRTNRDFRMMGGRYPTFRKENQQAREICFPFPSRIGKESVREVRIKAAHHARFFEVEFIYHDKPVALPSLDRNKIMGIDLGVNNLAACACTTGQIFLLDGRRLKAANQWYNKERSRLQSIKDVTKSGVRPIRWPAWPGPGRASSPTTCARQPGTRPAYHLWVGNDRVLLYGPNNQQRLS